jgi:hypothetical protein
MLAYLDTAIGFAAVMLGVSLIIMILTQMISAGFSYRGASLLWGLETLLSKIDPTNLPVLTANAKELSSAVLTHTLVSDSVLSGSGGVWVARLLRWIAGWIPAVLKEFRLASAIRSDELVAILSHLANNPALLPAGLALPAGLVLPPGVVVPPGVPPVNVHLALEINSLLGTKNPIVDRQFAFVRDLSTAVAAAAGGPPPIPIANAVQLIQGTVDAVRKEAGKLESWFNSMMDRASQRFAMHVRIATIILAFAAAGIMQLDALQLLRNLYTNSDMRASFAGIAGSVNQIAQNLLPEGARTPDEVKATMAGLFTKAAQQALNDQKAAVVAAPANIKSRAEGEKWITDNVPPAQQQAVAGSYNKAVDLALNEFMRNSVKSASDIKEVLQKGGLQLFPPWSPASFFGHFWGILLSGAFLSLGAPFWFNSLKVLMNLRPLVAQKQKDEQQKAA